MRRATLAALLALACGRSDEAAPSAPPAPSAERCLAAAREVADAIAADPMAPLPASARRLGCSELYRRAPCARAWAALHRGDLSSADPAERIGAVLSACASAYCADLPPGVRACGPVAGESVNERVDLLVDLDRAVLAAEQLDPVTADELSRRSVLLREVTLARPPPADAGAVPEPQLALTVAADGSMLLGGDPVEAAGLPAELRKATGHSKALIIVADPKVSHRRVVEIVELAKAAGFEKLAISQRGAPP